MKFKSKAIEIEAWRWDCGEPMPEWVDQLLGSKILILDNDPSAGYIITLESQIGFTPEHWILLDTEGNPYPCHETVFQKKYERV